MVNNSIELTEADIQDLSPIVVDFVCRYGSCHKEMDLLAKRFGIPLEETYIQSSAAINSRAYAMISYLNGKPQLLETISFILQKGFGSKHPDLEAYSGILAKYGFTITVDGETHILSSIPSGLLEPERKTAMSWIEKNANPNVLGHLKDAKNSLGKGRFDYVLDDCRKALEALTTGASGFSDSLNELVKEGLILQGNKDRKADTEFLRAVYGFCSTLGSHTSAEMEKPDFEQASLGLFNTENCICFLLKRLEAAKAKGTKLECWA